MTSVRGLPMQSRRDAWVEINLGHLEENARLIRDIIPTHVTLMAIVKADGYGHGAAMIIPTLEASGVSMVGVASMDEALHLRQSGLRMPILVIGGIPDWAAQYAAEQDIQLTIFNRQHLSSLHQAYQQGKKRFKVHIKVDTGMHRIGVAWEQAVDFIHECQALDYLQVEGIFSHLADSFDPQITKTQMDRWRIVCSEVRTLPRYVHISNSGHALLPNTWIEPDSPNNLARIGLAFYGYGCPPQQALPLQPVMSVKGRILHIQTVPPHTGISYSHQYHTLQTSRIATVPIGYADGIPLRLSNKIEGLLGGHRIPQVGRITMDQMMFDITSAPDAMLGDTITLMGSDQSTISNHPITLDNWAEKADTIVYELMCSLRVRLPKTYTR